MSLIEEQIACHKQNTWGEPAAVSPEIELKVVKTVHAVIAVG